MNNQVSPETINNLLTGKQSIKVGIDSADMFYFGLIIISSIVLGVVFAKLLTRKLA